MNILRRFTIIVVILHGITLNSQGQDSKKSIEEQLSLYSAVFSAGIKYTAQEVKSYPEEGLHLHVTPDVDKMEFVEKISMNYATRGDQVVYGAELTNKAGNLMETFTGGVVGGEYFVFMGSLKNLAVWTERPGNDPLPFMIGAHEHFTLPFSFSVPTGEYPFHPRVLDAAEVIKSLIDLTKLRTPPLPNASIAVGDLSREFKFTEDSLYPEKMAVFYRSERVAEFKVIKWQKFNGVNLPKETEYRIFLKDTPVTVVKTVFSNYSRPSQDDFKIPYEKAEDFHDGDIGTTFKSSK